MDFGILARTFGASKPPCAQSLFRHHQSMAFYLTVTWNIYFHLLRMQLACFNLGYLFGPTRIHRSFLFISRIWNQKPFEVCQECKAKHHSCRLGLVYIREIVVKLRWCSCVHVFQYPSWFMNQPGSLNPRFAGKIGGNSNQLSCKTHWFLYFFPRQTNPWA